MVLVPIPKYKTPCLCRVDDRVYLLLGEGEPTSPRVNRLHRVKDPAAIARLESDYPYRKHELRPSG